VLITAALLATARADFVYPDFTDTTGLRLNGNASTSSCDDGGPYAYSPLHGLNDGVEDGSGSPPVLRERTDVTSEERTDTATPAQANTTARFFAVSASRRARRRARHCSWLAPRLRTAAAADAGAAPHHELSLPPGGRARAERV
jgi:hypothetical protein